MTKSQVVRRGEIGRRFVRIVALEAGGFSAERVGYSRLEGEVLTFGAAPYASADEAWRSLQELAGPSAMTREWTPEQWAAIEGWMNGGPWPAEVLA